MKEFPLLSMFNIHENLLESLLELQNYADVQAVLAKYDGERDMRARARTLTQTGGGGGGMFRRDQTLKLAGGTFNFQL